MDLLPVVPKAKAPRFYAQMKLVRELLLCETPWQRDFSSAARDLAAFVGARQVSRLLQLSRSGRVQDAF